MKKTLALLSSLTMLLIGFQSFAQGYFFFGGPVRGVWDGFTTGQMRLQQTINVAFLWGPTNSIPLVSAIQDSTPTNAPYYVDYFSAWSAILNDPNFHIAVDQNTSDQIVTSVNANGSWIYSTLGGVSAVPVTGTMAGSDGNDYKVFVIAWDKAYATPAMAAGAMGIVGWSSPFIYHAVNNIGTPLPFGSSGFIPFAVSIPEPASVALLALGGIIVGTLRHRQMNRGKRLS